MDGLAAELADRYGFALDVSHLAPLRASARPVRTTFMTLPEHHLDDAVPAHRGDPFAEQRAMARTAAVVDRSHRGSSPSPARTASTGCTC